MNHQPSRVLFMGTPAFAVPSLQALAAQRSLYEVVAVITQPDRPAGRGRQMAASAVKEAAVALGIPVLELTKLKTPETHETLQNFHADVAVVAAYGRILPPALLALPTLGCINVHASLLPRHRGASPIAHAILAGDSQSGISIMQMDEGLDTGPVYATRSLPIESTDTCETLTHKLAELGAQLLLDTLPAIVGGKLSPTPQNATAATYAPILKKEDGELHFQVSAHILERQVRAFDPWPSVFTSYQGGRLQVLKAHAVARSTSGSPGEILEITPQGILIACGEGALCITQVKPAGKKAMPSAAWVLGHDIRPGQHFNP